MSSILCIFVPGQLAEGQNFEYLFIMNLVDNGTYDLEGYSNIQQVSIDLRSRLKND